MAADEDEWICSGCVGDEYLIREIKKEGTRRKCTYCSKQRKCSKLAELAERVHVIFIERYETSDGYDRGDTPLFCVAEILGIDENAIAKAFVDYLSETHGGWAGDGDVDPYGDAYTYVETRSDGYGYARKWKELARSLRHESRYFNRTAHTILDEIFDGLDFGMSKHLVQPLFPRPSVVTTITPRSKQAVFYRAREARDEATVSKYLRDPFNELSAPPPHLARGGRMNPTGISLFYGAFDPETCIAELRPPVGTYAVIACFHVLRTVRLLDFEKLTEAYEPLSHFHPQYVAKRDRDTFLKAFAAEISIPVHPQDENLGYLPTQAVAEYLAQRKDLELDGLLFRSTQSGKAGANVVLFQHAAHVEPVKHTYEAGWYQPHEDLPEVTVVSTPIPPQEPTSAKVPEAETPSAFDISEQTLFDEPIEPLLAPPSPTLRLDPEGFRVEVIGTVKYNHAAIKVEYTTAAEKAAKEKAISEEPF